MKQSHLSAISTHIINQTMQDILPGILYSFAAIFIILDPILSVPIFAGMVKGKEPKEIHKQAFIAVAVAGGLMYLFLFFNTMIFDILGLNMPSFQIAGGILLFILGMQMTLGIDIGKCKDHSTTAARRCHWHTTSLRAGYDHHSYASLEQLRDPDPVGCDNGSIARDVGHPLLRRKYPAHTR